MDTFKTIEAKNYLSERFDRLVKEQVFESSQKVHVLDVIFDEGLPSDLSIHLNELQSRWMQNLLFEYLDKKNGDTPSALYKLVISENNNLKRYLATADDLNPRGFFDFSPIEQH